MKYMYFFPDPFYWFRITDLHAVWSRSLWSRFRTNPVLVKMLCTCLILFSFMTSSNFNFFMICIIVNYLAICEEFVVEHPDGPRTYFYVWIFENIRFSKIVIDLEVYGRKDLLCCSQTFEDRAVWYSFWFNVKYVAPAATEEYPLPVTIKIKA